MNRHTNTNRQIAWALAVGLGALVSVSMPAVSWGASGDLTSPVYSARAFVARGDAEVAAGHPGPAIVDYDRARLLAPRSTAVVAGLARARTAAGLPPAASTALSRTLNRLSPDEWSWVALAGFGLLALTGVGLSWGRRRRIFMAVGLAGALIAAGALMTARRLAPSPGAAVVIAPEVVARIAPFDAAEPTFVATEGSRIEIERVHQGFALIRGANGRGWVPRSKLETILPAPPPHA
jgi:hypothetical protein